MRSARRLKHLLYVDVDCNHILSFIIKKSVPAADKNNIKVLAERCNNEFFNYK